METKKGNYYYYGKVIRKFKCIKINTNKDKDQSDFIDYKKGLYQFYNEDMHLTKFNHISDILSEAIKKKHYEPIQELKNLYPELFHNDKNK